MKTKFENNFKKSLEDYEMPYDEKAWESLNSRLNEVMPVKNTSWRKWTYAAISTIVVLGAGYLYYTTNEVKTVKTNSTNETTQFNSETEIKEQFKQESNHSASKQLESEENTFNHSKVNEENISLNKKEHTADLNSNHSSSKTIYVVKPFNEEQAPKLKKTPFIPNIVDVCLGEKIKIENSNDNDLIIINPANKHTNIEAFKLSTFNPSVEGEYQIGYYLDDKFVTGDKFNVRATGTSDFTVENDKIYNENELPTVFLKAISNGVEYEWLIDKQVYKTTNKEFEAHFYKKGNYTISLTTINQNGCKAHETKNIKVAEDYNLLAVSGFDPYSSNYKTNTFIPYALTKRDVKFTMTVFDVSGREVYRTNNSHEPWSGVDPMTNEIVKSGSIYIWKVIIENPEEGEKNQYSGNITVISK